MRAVVDAARRLAHGVGGAGALGAVGHAAEGRGVRHPRARLEVGAVGDGALEPGGDQLDRLEGHGVVEELVVVARVALDRVRQRVHARRGGDRRRQPEHELGVDDGGVRRDEGGAADVELDLAARVGDHRPERHLAAGAGGGRHGDQRRDAALDGIVPPLVLRDRAAVGGHDADRLGDVHGRAAAHGHEAVAALGRVQVGGRVDEVDVGVGHHLGEDDRVGSSVDDAGGEAGGDDALVRDQERPAHAELRRPPRPGGRRRPRGRAPAASAYRWCAQGRRPRSSAASRSSSLVCWCVPPAS